MLILFEIMSVLRLMDHPVFYVCNIYFQLKMYVKL